MLLFYLMCRVILELEELQESQVPLVKRYVSSDDKKGISCSDSPHQIVSFIWLEQLNEMEFVLSQFRVIFRPRRHTPGGALSQLLACET